MQTVFIRLQNGNWVKYKGDAAFLEKNKRKLDFLYPNSLVYGERTMTHMFPKIDQSLILALN